MPIQHFKAVDFCSTFSTDRNHRTIHEDYLWKNNATSTFTLPKDHTYLKGKITIITSSISYRFEMQDKLTESTQCSISQVTRTIDCATAYTISLSWSMRYTLQFLCSPTINTFRWPHAYLNTNGHTNGSPFLICNTQIEHQLSRDESVQMSRQNARALANNAGGCAATETRRLEDAFRRINPVLNSAYAWRQNALKGYSILYVFCNIDAVTWEKSMMDVALRGIKQIEQIDRGAQINRLSR